MFERFFRQQKPAPVAKKRPGFFNTKEVLKRHRPKERVRRADINKRTAEIDSIARMSIQKTAADFYAVDAAGNRLASITTGMDQSIEEVKALNAGMLECLTPTQFYWYSGQGFIGYQACAIIAQNAFIDKACSMPAKDAMRHGWDTTVNDGQDIDPKIIDRMRDIDIQMNIQSQLIEWIHIGRVFGIRIAFPVIETDDPMFYENPFNIDAVKPGSYKGWTQIDPYWITPELDISSASNPADPNFYEPTWWRVNGKRYHRTHLLIFRNGRVADILKPTYLYGAPSIPQLASERLYNAEQTANEGPMLARTKRLTVLNADVTQAVSNPVAFEERMNAWMDLLTNYGVKVVGEDEKISQYDTSLADLDAVIMTQYQLFCGIVRVPSTKMLGTTPKGFSATGEYDEASYHEELESLQKNDARPFVQRHNELVVASYITPETGAQFKTTVVFKAVDSPTAKEQAELNKLEAETDQILVNAGIIDGLDGRQRISNDPDSGYSGIPEVVPGGPGDREAQQEADKPLEQPVSAKVSARAEGTGQDAEETAALEFDPATGNLGGARLITHQKFLDDAIVRRKAEASDFEVFVTPAFEIDGRFYRMILDGHHSLAAALMSKIEPVFTVQIPKPDIMNACTRAVMDGLRAEEKLGSKRSKRKLPR